MAGHKNINRNENFDKVKNFEVMNPGLVESMRRIWRDQGTDEDRKRVNAWHDAWLMEGLEPKGGE